MFWPNWFGLKWWRNRKISKIPLQTRKILDALNRIRDSSSAAKQFDYLWQYLEFTLKIQFFPLFKIDCEAFLERRRQEIRRQCYDSLPAAKQLIICGRCIEFTLKIQNSPLFKMDCKAFLDRGRQEIRLAMFFTV